MTQEQMQRIDRIFDAIFKERKRQEELKAAGKFRFTCADPEGLSPSQKYTVLAEETGEVARVVLNLNGLVRDYETTYPLKDERDAKMAQDLKEELLQVAAVCVGWVESLEKEGGK